PQLFGILCRLSFRRQAPRSKPMAVPGFQAMFLPFLRLLADGKDHDMADVRSAMEKHFKLTKEQIEETVPSGQSRFQNRVGWCRTHLTKAGLIERVDWGIYRITDAGRQLVANPPPKLDLKFLDTIPQHMAWFHAPKREKSTNPVDESTEATAEQQPPDERIEEAFQQLNDSLAAELLQAMGKMDPFRFEQLVVDLLFAMGYGGSRKEAAQVTKKTNDEGIDGVINEDRLGLDTIYIQAKRWQANVGRKEIQSFVGALAG